MKSKIASTPRHRNQSYEQWRLEKLAKDSLVYLADIEDHREKGVDDAVSRWVLPHRKGTPLPAEKKSSFRRTSRESNFVDEASPFLPSVSVVISREFTHLASSKQTAERA